MPSCDFLKIYQWVRRMAVRGGANWLHFVFIWSEKFYFLQGKVKEFCTLTSVAV